MKRSLLLVSFLTMATMGGRPAPARAQSGSPLTGVWTLDRSASEFPREVGFNVSWMPTASTEEPGSGAGAPSSGRGRRESSGTDNNRRNAPSFAHPESYEDAQRLQLLTAEVRTPPSRLTIVDAADAVTVTNELGQSRTFHPDGKAESIELQRVPVSVTSLREGDRLVVLYHVEQDRDLRYTYSSSANPSRLIVDVQFLEHGTGDKVRRVYAPGTEPTAPTSTSAAPVAAPAGQQAAATFDQRPGAEFKGLKTLGILVENLSAQAIACGLNHDAIESAASKQLTDAGFVVRRNADDDTYVYINVMTNSAPNGLCVSRYDAFLYTYTTAALSYHDRPVLVQVSLMHHGGISSGASSTHATAVARDLQNYLDLFITQIRDANK
jgi:hypothetical protein